MASRLYNHTEYALKDVHANRNREAKHRLNYVLDILHAHIYKKTRLPNKETT